MTMVNVTLLFVLAAWIVGRDDGRAARRHAHRPGARGRRRARDRSPPSPGRSPPHPVRRRPAVSTTGDGAGAHEVLHERLHELLSGARAAAADRRVRRGGVARDDLRRRVAQRALRDRVPPARVAGPGAPPES
jgi:hypothetical protein